jgi:hypothetical protein
MNDDSEKQHALHHPLEDVFNMDIGSTPLNLEQKYDRVEASELMPVNPEEQKGVPDIKDDDDIATDKRLDEVYNAAIETFHNQTAYTEILEPRYAARNAEVAAQFLNIALSAATSKAKVKQDRKRTNAAFIPYNNKTNANIIADRNDLLNMITVDGETKEIK